MTSHPFVLKTVLFAQRVVLIHSIAQWKGQRLLAAAADYNLLVAAIATIPVVITGIVAWQREPEGQKLKEILKDLLMYLVMRCVSTALIWAMWFIHRRTRPNHEETLPGYRLPIEAVAVFIGALTGHLGGFLSGVNGRG